MRLSRIVAILLVFPLLLQPFCVSAEDVASENTKIVKVGNLVISQQDLDFELQSLIPMNLSFHSGVKPEVLKELKDEALQNLIDRAYKVQYAIDEEISVDPKKMETVWQDQKNKNAKRLSGASADQLSKLRAGLYLDMLAENAEKEAVDNLVVIEEDAVKKYYLDNKDSYLKPKSYEASHILVKVDPAASMAEKEQRKKRADVLYQRAINGEDFYNLAYYESDDRSKYVGGKLGSFHAGQTVQEFDQALKGMQPGEISKPVMTMYGYHIIRLDSLEEERQLTYDEAAKIIRDNMKKDVRQKIYQEWLNRLHEKYPLQKYE